MCGIIAVAKGVKQINCKKHAEKGLQRLIYRGYDSWGFSTLEDHHKEVGEFKGNSHVKDSEIVLGHTRWATHGGVTEANAHPHTDCTKRFHVAHNGSIENHERLKKFMEGEPTHSHEYKSETDTEVIAHWMEREPENPVEMLKLFDEHAEGNYAIVILDREENQLYALKRGSPLVFGFPTVEDGVMKHPKGAYFASDLYAVSDKLDEAFFMKDGDIIKTSGSNLALMRDGEWLEGFPVDEWKEFEWTEEEPELGDKHRYWMEKEIREQPEAMKRLSQSLLTDQKNELQKIKTKAEKADKVVFTASGTSYHATLLGVYYLQKNLGIDAQTIIASEFEDYNRINEDTLVIAVSQSGETRDVLNAMNQAREMGAEIGCLVNVPHSTIQRKADFGLEIKAQQENCVAATKTFSNQVYTLMKLADADHIEGIADKLDTEMNQLAFAAYQDAQEFHQAGHEDLYIIGNSSTYPVAREIALKIKEIAYIHAEGMMAGELKHGTLALIEEGTPVIALDDGTGKIQTNIEEVEARGGRTKTFKNEGEENQFVFAATTYGFFLALYWAHLKDLPVDKPRNLAKSVTVE